MTARFSQYHSGRIGIAEKALFCDNITKIDDLIAMSGYPKSSLLFHLQSHLYDTHSVMIECNTDETQVKKITCTSDSLAALKLFFAKEHFPFENQEQVIEETATASYMIPETKPVSDSDVYADLSELDSEEQAKDAKKAAKKAAK